MSLNQKSTSTTKSNLKTDQKPLILKQPAESVNEPLPKLSSETKKTNAVIVSVKDLVAENQSETKHEVDEVTKLFRKMIGIDKADHNSTIVRQFACYGCYKSWWKRVRIIKQVSSCVRCKIKYDPIPFDKEFGIAEFVCTHCNHVFYHWCPKDGYSVCKQCNNMCAPIKIMTKSNVDSNMINPSNSNSSSSSSSCTASSSGGGTLSNNTGNSSRYRYLNKRNFHCKKCCDTNINLNCSIVFRPKDYEKYEYLNDGSFNNFYGVKFCTVCRKIPIFSVIHASTGSTMASLSTSYQNDLELRFDDFECMDPCVEEEDEQISAASIEKTKFNYATSPKSSKMSR